MTLDLKLDLTSELSDLDLNLTWVSSTLSLLKQGKQHWLADYDFTARFLLAQPILTIIQFKQLEFETECKLCSSHNKNIWTRLN